VSIHTQGMGDLTITNAPSSFVLCDKSMKQAPPVVSSFWEASRHHWRQLTPPQGSPLQLQQVLEAVDDRNIPRHLGLHLLHSDVGALGAVQTHGEADI